MDPRLSFVTLAVADLDRTRAFYLDGLGWTAEVDVPGEVLMVRVGERTVLSLWAVGEFEAEVGRYAAARASYPSRSRTTCAPRTRSTRSWRS